MKRLRFRHPRPRWDVLLKQPVYQRETSKCHDASKMLLRHHQSTLTRHHQSQKSVNIAFMIYKHMIVRVLTIR